MMLLFTADFDRRIQTTVQVAIRRRSNKAHILASIPIYRWLSLVE